YKRFPIAGLALMSSALALLAIVTGHPSRTTAEIGIGIFGLGFGMVTQVLIVAVQNGVEQRRIGIATAATSFFRGLGGAVGAALFGAVFAGRVGAGHASVIGGVQAVFMVAAPIAVLALIVVTRLPEVPLRTQRGGAGAARAQAGAPAGASEPVPAR